MQHMAPVQAVGEPARRASSLRPLEDGAMLGLSCRSSTSVTTKENSVVAGRKSRDAGLVERDIERGATGARPARR